MALYSSYSLPKDTTPDPNIFNSLNASPWSDILLDELQLTIESHRSLELVERYGYLTHKSRKTRLWRSRFLWLSVIITMGLWWALEGGQKPAPVETMERQGVLVVDFSGLQFIEASNPYIRYVGRWTSSLDGAQRDGSFPGVYFEFALNGSANVFLSLRNAEVLEGISASSAKLPRSASIPIINSSTAAPPSLLARVDDDEYTILENANFIVPVRRGNLDPRSHHKIRIIAPIVGGVALETLRVEGIWIDSGGQLLPSQNESENEVISKLDGLLEEPPYTPKKMLEVVTDQLGWVTGRTTRMHAGSIHGILYGVMGWEYLLGEMFGVDHVTIGMEGMCLIEDCVGGNGSPSGLADIFFQSGPVGSEQFQYPWLFQAYVPDIIVMNIGDSDWISFQTHLEEYNQTVTDLHMKFVETYISMIKVIRTLAYPAREPTNAIPIFIMRPFRGQLEQAAYTVVERLRIDGDNQIYWVDTSGWLNMEVDFDGPVQDQDFFLDGESSLKQWRLTERGNQRVAILLHLYVCRYLAQDVDKCAFH